MNSKYKVLKYSSNKFENIDDLISIEEPLEISLKFKESDKWINQSLSITMRTPGDDEDLVRGFLYNEQIITNISDIDSIESYGDKVGQYNIQNKILATLNNSKNINISKIKRDFLTNSSCGVCGKSSLDALEIIKKNIENEKGNLTRFLIMGKNVSQPEFKNNKYITSFLFKLKSKPAALYQSLGGFAINGVNLTKLQSYPEKNSFDSL